MIKPVDKNRTVFILMSIFLIIFLIFIFSTHSVQIQNGTTIHKYLGVFITLYIIFYFVVNKYLSNIFAKLSKAKFLLDNTNDAVYVVNLQNGAILEVNQRALDMLGYTQEEMLCLNVFDIRKEDKNNHLDWNSFKEKLFKEKTAILRSYHTKKDGSTFPIEASIRYVQDEEADYMIAVVRDITTQLTMEQNIQKKSNELQRLQNVISKSVLYTTSDLDGNITSCSKAFEKLMGYKEEEIIGKNHSIFKHSSTPKEFYTNMWEILNKNEQFTGDLINCAQDRTECWFHLTIDPIFDENNQKIGYSSYRENITTQKELEYISTHDHLTTLYNRGFFQDIFSKKVYSANRYGQVFGLIMFDIDHFKNINDTYGHDIGDEVLQKLSRIVKKHIRTDDTFARWGGEEFVIIVNEVEEKKLIAFTQKIQNEIRNITFEHAPSVTVSFGLAFYKHGDTTQDLQKRADEALYIAKKNGRDQYVLL